jgi:5'-methylthioadenosine phosphorylase
VPAQADIAVIGGTGFSGLLEDARWVDVETPYGSASDQVALGSLADKAVAFLPRHGRQHTLPPHRINYRANLWALRELGVSRVIAPNAAGSLQAGVRPGEFVVLDQLVDRTRSRAQTFFDGPRVVHVNMAEPYCPQLRPLAVQAGRSRGETVHDGGTCVVIEGPRFSTRAESAWFTAQGWSVINMTQYPECVLARELDLCYCGVSLITDYDAALVGGEAAVTHREVLRVFAEKNANLVGVLERMISSVPAEHSCSCARATAEGSAG